MAENIKRIKIPKGYTARERGAISQAVVDRIVERTRQGKNIKGDKWSGGYSDAYKKSAQFKRAGKSKGKIDLTLSSEMLDELKPVKPKDLKETEIAVGYDKRRKTLNGKVEGNRTGTYGTGSPIRGKKRDFLGISREDLKRVLKDFPLGKKGTERRKESVAVAESEVERDDG